MASIGKAGNVDTALQGVGTFVVLDLTMVSPAAFMQALLSTWKIITNICGSVGHLYLWVYIARTPCS